jgi:hypothetical protein
VEALGYGTDFDPQADPIIELVKKFPDGARGVEDYIRMYFHFDHWVAAVLEGLEKSRKAAGK